ncbi:hypothetical protein P3H15_11325 [Rhodococcus sp. T2V]|uniref:hypothetical protein n=1 Tax=Rhodococcus sp. T2V TaxID=3034164 RepID=UPI0023E2C23E|nr:hypothetical protein [Rhodococcus sp. T2V]MDF3305611.1 hypothetical protein [Rhodococcus sp. T2V]
MPEEFIPIRPALVKRVVDGNAAIVYALIEFRCKVTGEDRIEDESGRWWRAPSRTLSEVTGLTVSRVDTALKNLHKREAIEAVQHKIYGPDDHAFSYRVIPLLPAIPEIPEALSAAIPEISEARPRDLRGAPPRSPKSSSSFKKREEGGERVTVPEAISPEASPPPRCPKHIDNPTTAACGACGDARRARATWDAETLRAAKVATSAEAHVRAEVTARGIAECDLCDEYGYANRRVCNHNPAQAETNRAGIAAVRAALAAKKASA